MQRAIEDPFLRSLLDRAAEVHHQDLVGDVADHRQVEGFQELPEKGAARMSRTQEKRGAALGDAPLQQF
jgi:hypothetical protein